MSRMVKSRPAQVDQRVRDELAGTVVGDLSAAVDVHDGNAVVAPQVLAPARQSQRVDGRMLGEPDLVDGLRIARGGERLHRAPRRRVVGEAEFADRDGSGSVGRRRRGVHQCRHSPSTTNSCSCPDTESVRCHVTRVVVTVSAQVCASDGEVRANARHASTAQQPPLPGSRTDS